ncbi:putative 2-aminoethylphosphonate ABC transporter ATP-binding protein [Zavarzinia sp. CC-PAN008]|uniref:putative 2-aminoethylphosphonate ABC transporter ATP-binding protein n=1 Tax=Zavarzinia sp. CC-PAN008 TaxID=3243332 RepID=UPI003F744003
MASLHPETGEVPYLSVRGVTKRFGSATVLHGVDLDVMRGEFVCFLGPSGCGKTTLLRAISGLDVQTSGQIFQDGRDISALAVQDRDFGIVFQSYALFPNLTVRANIAYGLESRGRPRAEIRARVDELLDMVGLPEHANKYPAQLSGGQQQRVAIARALALSPGLLLLDEPLSALDARVRARLRGEIRDLQRRLGITTIMVTHDQEEAMTMADRIVVMNKGRIDQVGTPTEIYAAPATPFVADFIGKMNFLNGHLIDASHVDLRGAHITFQPATTFAPGLGVSACIRPEDIQVRGIAPDAPNRLVGQVGIMEFMGSHFLTTVHVDGTNLSLSAALSLTDVRDLGIASGQSLGIALPPERILVFPTPA